MRWPLIISPGNVVYRAKQKKTRTVRAFLSLPDDSYDQQYAVRRQEKHAWESAESSRRWFAPGRGVQIDVVGEVGIEPTT